jgi:cell division septum initiation protein DivIVA
MRKMKRIKSIKQLTIEKKLLRQRRDELEKAIKYDWRDVKESIRPKNVSEQFFSKMFDGKGKQQGDSLVAEGISQATATFAKKLVGKAEGRIGKWLRK